VIPVIYCFADPKFVIISLF